MNYYLLLKEKFIDLWFIINKMIKGMIWSDRLSKFCFLDDVVDNMVNVRSVHKHILRHYHIDRQFFDCKQYR
jgi:hypothetical protein